MNLKELVEKLQEINNMGYVKALRKGNTGIGYTFENLIGLEETNIPIPDIGGRVEIKTTRKDSSSLVTLFTFNRGVWIRRPKEIIEQFGYEDEKGRKALKSTIFFNKPNSLGLIIEIDESKHVIRLLTPNIELIAEWDVYVVVGVFSSKLSRLLFVLLVGIDLRRMHLQENGTVRNRGTGFRMREKDMLELYGNKRKLL